VTPADQPAPPVVRVIPDVTALRRQFDYLVPDHLAGLVEVGTEVRVVLHGRRVRAWVSAVGVQSPVGVTLRPLAGVRGVGPPPAVVDLAQWAAWRWAGTAAHFLRTASSARVVRAAPSAGTNAESQAQCRAESHAHALAEAHAHARADAPTEAGGGGGGAAGTAGSVTAVRSTGVTGFGSTGRTAIPVDLDVTAALAGGTTVVQVGPAADIGPILRAAAERLQFQGDDRGVTGARSEPAPACDAVAEGDGIPEVVGTVGTVGTVDTVDTVGGPVGAGFDQPRRGVLVVVPQSRQVALVAGIFRSMGVPVAELPGQWAMARGGGCVVIGSRAAAWAPLPDLAAAIVLDAHDELLVEQASPTWSAVAVVAERARRSGAPCVLVSSCPTLELTAARRVVQPARRAERQGWPPVEVVDLRVADPRQGLLTNRVVDLARWAVAGQGTRRIVGVVNRTGGARLVLCAACGDVARCEHCGSSLELVGDNGRQVGGAGGAVQAAARMASAVPAALTCRRCGTERPVVCARCGSTATKALRLGVSRLRRDLEVLAGGPVAELTAAEGDDPVPLADDVAVVVGTDAALRRGLSADAVLLLDFDGELLAPRMRSAEQALALLARSASIVADSTLPGAEGRAPGRVLVQTRLPTHPVVRAAVAGDPSVLQAAELAVRRTLRLPPVTAVAQISGAGAPALIEVLRVAVSMGEPAGVVEIDGPFDGLWTVRAPDHDVLCDLLASVKRPAGRIRVDVDPVRL